jgi:maltooligosyltrehalose synthase
MPMYGYILYKVFDTLKRWEEEYYHFFFDIIDSELDPKPKILMPTLLLSENNKHIFEKGRYARL